MFFCWQRRKEPPKMITGISWIGFLSKHGRFVTHNCFSKIGVLKPYFYSMFGGARFLGQFVKRGNFWTPPPKKKKIMTDNWKLTFWYFLVCLVVFPFVLVFCFFCVCCFFGGFKGQVRWPEGPPHLALNPPYFVFVCCSSFPFFAFNRKNCFPPW